MICSANRTGRETLVHLYSFSKAYRLTGHRVGAIATGADLLAEIEKFLDTVAICPGQIGQFAALWGMQNLSQWVAGERAEILDRRTAIQEELPRLADKGWRLLGLGAYFRLFRASVRHPFGRAGPPACARSRYSCCCPAQCSCPTMIRLENVKFALHLPILTAPGSHNCSTACRPCPSELAPRLRASYSGPQPTGQ